MSIEYPLAPLWLEFYDESGVRVFNYITEPLIDIPLGFFLVLNIQQFTIRRF